MKLKKLTIYCLALFCASSSLYAQSGEEVQKKRSGNPIFPGWYADPEGVVLDGKFWIYPTYSAPYDEQTFMDAYSSPDLVHWTKHPRVLSKENIPWLRRALWAPAVIEANDRYYLFFGGNDIQNNSEIGGIGVAVADNPAGPFKDVLGKPLIDKIVNGAQPIDQFVFRDDDGTYYMYYGGWGHCNIVKLSPDLLGVVPFDDGTVYKEVTPQDYVEGPFMLKRNGKYYFMWSEGGWGSPDYRVAYAIADSPFGPFHREGIILQQDAGVATGAGHHSVVRGKGKDEWYIIYHRRPLGETAANSRATCIDRMYFDKKGKISRGDVDGTQLFIAEVYQSSSASQPIARAGVRIIDTADEFQIVCYITSSNKEVDTGQPVTVSAKIVNMTTGSTYTPTSASWTMDVMDKENWKSLKHSTTNSISVTTTETDRNGTQYDVDVLAECHFN